MNEQRTINGYRPVSVLAVLGFLFSATLLFSLVGLVLSVISLEQFRHADPECPVIGRNLAVAGTVIGATAAFLMLVGITLSIAMGSAFFANILSIL